MSSPSISQPSTSSQGSFLDWRQRTEEINDAISSAFGKIVGHSCSSWGIFNGDSGYDMCGVREYALMKQIILQAPGSQKDFYALDIGAGNFQWSRGLSDFLQKQTNLPSGIKVHIFGIRGESNFWEQIVETDLCKIYSLGAFKVEELFLQFKEQKFDLENKVDLIISRWCFRHLADPVGTFAQTYPLLRPQTGFFLLDGFAFRTKLRSDIGFMQIPMTQFFIDLGVPFLTEYNDSNRSWNHFMMQRPDARPCRIPMSYSHLSDAPQFGVQIGSERITVFQRESQESDRVGFDVPLNWQEKDMLFGDKKIYDWLKKNGLLQKGSTVWRPLQKKDKPLGLPSIHQAVLAKDRDKLEALLNLGEDIDVSDAEGATALHLSIEKGDFLMFELLLQREANLQVVNGNDQTPLHVAARFDRDGRFISALIEAGADMNAKAFRTKAILDCAIEEKNLKAIEILIQAGVEISKQNFEDLNSPVFLSLRGSIPLDNPKGSALANVCQWMKGGDCVVLHHDGSHGRMYYDSTLSQHPRLIYVDINPEWPVLEDGEWPFFLQKAGCKLSPYDESVVSKGKFFSVHKLAFLY